MAKLNQARRDLIARMRAKGLTFKQIGAKLKPPVTGACVQITAERMGIPGRIKLRVDMRGKKA